jgi:hypothetical protein
MKPQKLIVLAVVFVFCAAAYGQAEGTLQLVYFTEPWSFPGRVKLTRTSERTVTDYFDDLIDQPIDDDYLEPPLAFLCSRIFWDHHRRDFIRASWDLKPADANDDSFLLELSYWGNVISPLKNSLLIHFYIKDPCDIPFGDKYVFAVSQHLRYGWSADIKGINKYCQPDPNVRMLPIAPRHYDFEVITLVCILVTDSPYCICDFNGDGVVNLTDFTVLTINWGSPRGKHKGDVSSEIEGVPDGFVDIYDLIYYTDTWLFMAQDLNSDGAVNFLDYAAMASNWLAGGKGDIAGDYNYPDSVVNYRDLCVLAKQWPTER